MNFEKSFIEYFDKFKKVISTGEGDWTVKGFIDVYKNIYTISVDTKVISKIVELMLFPVIQRFAVENNFNMVLSQEQNHYPDITFIGKEGNKIALENLTELSGKTISEHSMDAIFKEFCIGK